MGYYLAGFDVEGVDLEPQPRYPFPFHQGDAVEFIRECGREYDVIAGSPTCRRWTNAQKIRGNEHPDLITPTREAMKAAGKPYVIENVEGREAVPPAYTRFLGGQVAAQLKEVRV